MLLTVTPCHAATQKNLQAIKLVQLPTGGDQLQLAFSAPVAVPASFLMTQPNQLILDFPQIHKGLQMGAALNQALLASHLVRAITITEDAQKTRITLFLKQAVTYQVNRVANQVTVDLQALSLSTAVKARQLTGFDFKRMATGVGRLLFQLNDNNATINFHTNSHGLIINFTDTQLAEAAANQYDVTDFGTQVERVTLSKQGDNIQATLKIRGDYQQTSFFDNKQFVVDIKPKAAVKNRSKKPVSSHDSKQLSLNFQDIKVRAALQIIAEFTGLNMIISDSVKGNMTLRLENVPWHQALEIILKTQGLVKRQFGNVLLIAPADEMALRESQEYQAKQQLENLAPLQAELLQVSYGKAKDLADILKDKTNALLSSRGSVSVDLRTNSLWVQDTPAKLAEVRRFLQQLDIPAKQILIEARIVNINKGAARDLGIKWGVSSPHHLSGTLKGANDLTTKGSADPADRLNLNLTGSDLDYTNKAHATLGLAMMRLGNTGLMLDLELSALETENKGRVLSAPRLVTANQQAAMIQSGEEIPYQEASSSGAATTAFKKAVLGLQVTPQITPDNRVMLKLAVNQDSRSPNSIEGQPPAIQTQQIETNVLVDNGETVVLGGILTQNETNQVQRVPFLSAIPILGNLFKSMSHANTEQELLIFVTPKIIESQLVNP